MRTEFRKADPRTELRSLMIFDRKVFSAADAFDAQAWSEYQPYWLLLDCVKAGCCAFEPHVEFEEDLGDSAGNPPRRGSLYITTTGILPRFQGRGLGTLMKAWQIAYARRHGFTRIVTNTRARNAAMLSLNRKFGFRVLRTTPDYYDHPTDAVVVMELLLPPAGPRVPGARRVPPR